MQERTQDFKLGSKGSGSSPVGSKDEAPVRDLGGGTKSIPEAEVIVYESMIFFVLCNA